MEHCAEFSLLMAVYEKDSPEYLDEAMASIWDNQELRPMQIVLVKDGKLTDELDKVIAIWSNKLGEILTIVTIEQNVGLGSALNKGLTACKFELIARMDADDVSLPHRFKEQIRYMLDNPEIVASSGVIDLWNESMNLKTGSRKVPTGIKNVLHFSKRRSPLNHPATVFRRSPIIDVGGYPPLRKAQDHALWSLLVIHGYRLDNLPIVLVNMRCGKDLFKRRGVQQLKNEYALLNYQRSIGFISFIDYCINLGIKAFLRLSPLWCRKLLYRLAH